jgi:hypothetical protein
MGCLASATQPHRVKSSGLPLFHHRERPVNRPHCPLLHPAAATHRPPGTGLHTGAPARAPPLHGADTTADHPRRPGIDASRRHRPGTRVPHCPPHPSGGRCPHCHSVLLGCRKGGRRPHCPPHCRCRLKAEEEAAAPTTPSPIKVREICTYIFTTRWIVDCG